MTIREKRLAGGVGGAVALLLGYQIVSFAVVRPFRGISDDLEIKRNQKAQLEARKKLETANAAAWTQRSARTLGFDTVLTQQRFRDDMQRLLNAHGLERNGTVTNGSPTTAKNGLISIPLNVTAKGSLSDLVGLLKDFYRRPYMGQITRLALDAGEQKPKTKGKEKADELGITMTVTTLVLPKMAGVQSTPIVDPEQITAQVNETRLAMTELSEYDRIVSGSIFRWPTPVVVHKPVEVVASDPVPDRKKDKDKPPPPPPNDKHVLCGVVSLEGQQIAYVRDESRREQPPQEHKVNESLDGGKIVLIHPLGMVVRMEQRSGETAEPKDYFYPLGKLFKDREELDSGKHPEIAVELQIAAGA